MPTATAVSVDATRESLRAWGEARGEVDSWKAMARSIAREASSRFGPTWQSQGPAHSTIDVVDLFSGCGGLSAGFEAVGRLTPSFTILGAADTDEVANESYHVNLGIDPARVDVRCLAEGNLSAMPQLSSRGANRPLVVVGGPPCQGFSSHRHSGQVDDARNSLIVCMASVAIGLRADAVVIENVPELLTKRSFDFVTSVRGLLEDDGYFVHLGVHNAAEFHVPQERFRALIIALRWPFSPPTGFLDRADFRTVREAIGELPEIDPGERLKTDPLHRTAAHRKSTVETMKAVPLDGGNRPPDVGPPSLQRAAEKNGKPAYEDVYGRLYWDRPSITITAHARNPASGRYVHPSQHRGLSIREAALLQGFPRSWHLHGSLDDGFRQLGNAVPPPFAAALAGHLLGEMAEPATSDAFDPGITEPVGASFSRLIPALKSGARTL